MNKSTFKSLSLDNDKGEACVFFGASTSNYEDPKFTISLGYFASDGDRWELSSDQLLNLREMINDVIDSSGYEKPKGSYKNDFGCCESEVHSTTISDWMEEPANSQGD